MDFANKKCGIELDKIKLEKKELELMFIEYQHAWECCEQGGNFTSQGFCSYEWQDKVILLFLYQSLSHHLATSSMEKSLRCDANRNASLGRFQRGDGTCNDYLGDLKNLSK